MRKSLLYILLFGVMMSALFAKSMLPKYEGIRLDNGLQVVVIPLDNKSGIIQTDVFYKVGSRNETMGKSGIAHMLEHLSFKSTKHLKAGEFDEIVKQFGGVDNASTGFDYTRYYIKSTTQNIDKSLELFAELMSNLAFKNDEFLAERQVVAEERRWRTDNSPVGYLYFRFFNTAFVYHPYHWTPIGFMDDILGWKMEDIRAFYEQYYQPNNAIIVVAGDIEPKVVFEKAKKHFNSIKNKHTHIPEPKPEPAQDGYREVIIHKDTQIEWLAMGYKIPNFEHKDQVALKALSFILGGGRSSILEIDLVDKKRLVSDISVYPMALRDSGIFMIMAGGNQGIKAEKIKQEILAIIEKIKQGTITQEELDRAKNNIRAGFVLALETSSSIAGLFGSYLVRGNIQPLLKYEEQFAKLTLKDIQEVAQKYFVTNSLSVAILKQ